MLSNSSLETLFTKARSQNGWLNKDITDEQIQQLYDLLKFGQEFFSSSLPPQ